MTALSSSSWRRPVLHDVSRGERGMSIISRQQLKILRPWRILLHTGFARREAKVRFVCD
jgi:hypothetical protein